MEDQITYQDLVARLAPCGIDCERCFMYEEGRARRLASGLAEALSGFDTMVPRVADRAPALRDYDRFIEVLAFCSGIRATSGR